MTLRHAAYDRKNYGLRAFLLGLLLAAIIVAPIMIKSKGYFIYYGDFNAQQIPFYRLAHDSILNGDIGWSHLTDLGANFIGSYSFYLLCSPFFLITLLLPSEWVAYAMGPLLILKLGCSSLSGYVYLRRHVSDRRWAVIGGLLYAFSAFSVYNIFYFHFHEPIIIFPLLLAAVDEFHYTGRKGLIAPAVFAAAVMNYYFFFGMTVFVGIYWLIRCLTRTYRFRIKDTLLMFFEYAVGFLMSMFVMLPSLAAVVGNYRVSEFVNGWSALLYNSKRYVQILIALFFPGDIPSKLNYVPKGGAQWSSIAAYLPLFGMIFVLAYARKYKKSFSRIMLTALIIMACVPALNSMFQAMNSAYYARWFYMLTLMTAMITIKSLDSIRECDFNKGFIPSAIVTGAVTLLIGFTPYESFRNSTVVLYKFGLEESKTYFWLFSGITCLALGATWLLYLLYRKKPKAFFAVTSVSLCVFIVGYSTVYMWFGKREADFDEDYMIEYALNGGEDVTLSDLKEVRSDFYNAPDNLGMYWEIPNIQAFHSVVPAALMDFYNKSGEKRDVASRPELESYGLRALLSVKYLFSRTGYYNESTQTPMPGFTYLRNENGYDIFVNEYYLPMGFTYDAYYSEEEYLDLSDKVKHLAILKGMVLSQEQMKKYRDITGYTDGMYLELNSGFDENHLQNKTYPVYTGFKSITSGFRYTKLDYFRDVRKLRANTCESFAYTKDGFQAVFDNKGGDDLLFFSVPYDEGWTAYVNGEEVGIEKVNIGFMAVPVEGGKVSEIEFRYKTPYLYEGVVITAAGLGLYLIYITACLIIKRKKGIKRSFRRKYRVKTDNHNINKVKED